VKKIDCFSFLYCVFGKSSFVHLADLCRGGVRVRVSMVRTVIDRYAM